MASGTANVGTSTNGSNTQRRRARLGRDELQRTRGERHPDPDRHHQVEQAQRVEDDAQDLPLRSSPERHGDERSGQPDQHVADPGGQRERGRQLPAGQHHQEHRAGDAEHLRGGQQRRHPRAGQRVGHRRPAQREQAEQQRHRQPDADPGHRLVGLGAVQARGGHRRGGGEQHGRDGGRGSREPGRIPGRGAGHAGAAVQGGGHGSDQDEARGDDARRDRRG
jgi:hypothetical protein